MHLQLSGSLVLIGSSEDRHLPPSLTIGHLFGSHRQWGDMPSCCHLAFDRQCVIEGQVVGNSSRADSASGFGLSRNDNQDVGPETGELIDDVHPHPGR